MHSPEQTNALVNTIKGFDRFVFLSPHLDDAVLSAAFLLVHLKKMTKDIRIITFFTQASSRPYSNFARFILMNSDYIDADEYYKDRCLEDRTVMQSIGARYAHTGLTDSPWRKTVWGTYIYDSGDDLFAGKAAWSDWFLKWSIRKLLRRLVNGNMDCKTLYFAPLGLGGHVDHIIIRDAAMNVCNSLLLWEDVPYNSNAESRSYFMTHHNDRFRQVLTLAGNKERKRMLISFYASQLKPLFPDGTIPLLPERYYKHV